MIFFKLLRLYKLGKFPVLQDGLIRLICNNCTKLQSLPELPSELAQLDCVNCTSLKTLPELPEDFQLLNCSGCVSLQSLPKLQWLRKFISLGFISGQMDWFK